jgi:hypothetical protein
MSRIKIRSLLITIALLLAGVAPAAAQMDDASRKQALQIAVAWLEQNTVYKKIPEVRFWVPLTKEQMAQQATRGNVFGPSDQVFAIYACDKQTLYFRSDVNFYSPSTLSVLVHEMTHHAQCITHHTPDLCSMEREAYLNQQKFIREIPAKVAKTGQPLSPQMTKDIVDYASGIDNYIQLVCKAPGANR